MAVSRKKLVTLMRMVLNSRGELVGVDLQEVEIVAEALRPQRLHAHHHPTHEAGPLVAGEVEPAALLEVGEQRLELGQRTRDRPEA